MDDNARSHAVLIGIAHWVCFARAASRVWQARSIAAGVANWLVIGALRASTELVSRTIWLRKLLLGHQLTGFWKRHVYTEHQLSTGQFAQNHFLLALNIIG